MNAMHAATASPRVLVAAPAVSALEQLEAHMANLPPVAGRAKVR